ncbi:DNA glycosylase [Pholiota molesta]|nr:DNA glycosylase [Pholiota molesta]
MRTKRPRSTSISGIPERAAALSSTSSQVVSASEASTRTKKLKLHSSFALELPFPEFEHPTPAEALEVFDLLSNAHRSNRPPLRKPSLAPSNTSQTCENAPNVIEALIGTILSQNTSAQNSTRAKKALDETFGRNNFAAIVSAPQADVVDAIRSGGLANKKAATIQKILQSIKHRHGDYSLQHLAAEGDKRMDDAEIMKELIAYDGVGPKTASCVLLFCLGRDSFAVDTHIFRLSKVLGWVPAKADRILTQAHLDLRVPNELKYGLHLLMIQHGRVCKGCKKSGSRDSCILKTYLKERKSQNPAEIEAKLELAKEEELGY